MSVFRSYHLPVIVVALMALLVMSGCADPAVPDNLEPVIELFEANEVTRTGATLSARVQKRGTSGLTYLTFRYGEAGNINREVSASDIDSQIMICRLSDLKPGTEYAWYVEGGTETATLRTETMSFSTIPNGLPRVSPLIALSTGPIGIIVSFDITDDGGEPILEAGCEVTDNSTLTTERIYLPVEDLKMGSHRMNIGGLSVETDYTFTPFTTNSLGETKGEPLDYTTRSSIVLSEPGSLSQLFAGATDVTLGLLTISGEMNGDDFRFLRTLLGAPLMPGDVQIQSEVTDIDLSDAVITEGGGSYGGNRFTSANEFSIGLMADCMRLRDIVMPRTATVLARDAFAHCAALERLTISADVRTVLPSADCLSLKMIAVSQANDSFTAIDGVLFTSDVTEIVWFPTGKSGAYALPPTVTSIGENAFTGTIITSLQIPASVTSISRGAFVGSSLIEISLPDNITNISEGMFQDCAELTTVRLGEGTRFIGNYVFDGTSLKTLYLSAEWPPFAEEEAFKNRETSITENCTLYVPAGSEEVYRKHLQWGLFKKIEEF